MPKNFPLERESKKKIPKRRTQWGGVSPKKIFNEKLNG